MVDHLGGDRRKLDEDQRPRSGFRIVMALGIILAGVALAIWRHAG
jgi:hypothetical protein